MGADETIRRVKMALAEAGYPDAHLEWLTSGFAWVDYPRTDEGSAAWWAAWELACPGGQYPCWGCYRDAQLAARRENVAAFHAIAESCVAGDCAHPDEPRWPPRELLQRQETRR